MAAESVSNGGKMPLRISEVFGHDVTDNTRETLEERKSKWCPFQSRRCTKPPRSSPLGICSLGDDLSATSICPVRFREGDQIFRDAGRLAFGVDRSFVVAPEMRILHVPRTNKRIGKIDFVLAKLDDGDRPIDFAALEVQSVYISGFSIRPTFDRFLETGEYPEVQRNRPDYRSSAQKRLMPQLSLKVPVFRRWGKRFFVVVDAPFFAALPPIRSVSGIENSEVTWLVYPLGRTPHGVGYTLGNPTVVFTLWDDVLSALREGEAPQLNEVLEQLSARVPTLRRFQT